MTDAVLRRAADRLTGRTSLSVGLGLALMSGLVGSDARADVVGRSPAHVEIAAVSLVSYTTHDDRAERARQRVQRVLRRNAAPTGRIVIAVRFAIVRGQRFGHGPGRGGGGW